MPYDDHDGSLSDWLGRFGMGWPGRKDPLWSRTVANRGAGLHPTRALRRFIEILRPNDHPGLLDFGPASGQSVTFFGQELGCRLVVSDLVSSLERATADGGAAARSEALTRGLEHPAGSMDGVVCWDLCDYLDTAEAEGLAAAVARALKPGGVVLAMFSTVKYEAPEVTRFGIHDIDHLHYRPVPSAMAQRQVWLSRDVSRVFRDLRVDESYLLSHGLREVLLRKPRAQR